MTPPIPPNRVPGIPGINLLQMSLTLIRAQTVIWFHCTGRILNKVGQDVSSYAPGFPVRGSFQPIERKLYYLYGLDLQKDYYNFYDSNNILDVQRDLSGDQLSYDGSRFQVESNTDWYTQDGWKGILCVYIGPNIADPVIWGFGTIPPSNGYKNFSHGNFLRQEIP